MSSVYDHPEWRAFVDRVREGPDDDAPRLIAADWLDERGEADRAELIRVQVAISRITDTDYDPLMHPSRNPNFVGCQNRVMDRERDVKPCRACHLRKRREELLKARALGDETWVGSNKIAVFMNRGFAEKVRCTAERWIDTGVPLLQREPVQRVRLLGKAAHWNGQQYCFYRGDRERPSFAVPTSAELPPVIFTQYWGEARQVGFQSPDEALDAVSKACLFSARLAQSSAV